MLVNCFLKLNDCKLWSSNLIHPLLCIHLLKGFVDREISPSSTVAARTKLISLKGEPWMRTRSVSSRKVKIAWKKESRNRFLHC